jgi:hypothetical protein
MNRKWLLTWPDGVPRFVVRRADDRRFFVWDLLHERRCTRLMIELASAERAVHECEMAARRKP